MRTYPLNLIGLARRKAVVIGGGTVALRKAEGLLEGGAQVTVISPALVEGLVALYDAGRIEVIRRPYRDDDLTGAWLVIAATDDIAVNHAVAAEAEHRGSLVNVVDDPAHSNFIVPAVVRRGEVALTISTGGASPALARRLRERVAELIGPEYGDLAGLLAELRPELLARFPPGPPRLEAALRLVDSDLLAVVKAQGMAAARVYALALLGTPDTVNQTETQSQQFGVDALAACTPDPGRPAEASSPDDQPNDFSHPSGIVYLIGAGPGDPGLITVRGLECLRSAEVVVYDRLIPTALLAEAPAAQWIDVGKRPGSHPVPQDQINALLVAHGRQSRRVARLKGGDPFVFGRGGEEAEALAKAGVPFEVVPGVTSAVAAAAYAGIPVTHREVARSFAVLTGHRMDDAADAGEEWERAAGADTLIFLMGVGNLPSIVEHLLAAGKPRETPAAVVARGTWPQQRTVSGTLQDIVSQVEAAGIQPPAALIVGEVVRLREDLRWFDRPDRRPLVGLRILNTRPAPEAADLTQRLTSLGAAVITLPATRIAPCDDFAALDAALQRLASGSTTAPAYDWVVFTSANAVRAFLDRLLTLSLPDPHRPAHLQHDRPPDVRCLTGVRIAAVGPATSEALRGYGLIADLVPERVTGQGLASALPDVSGQRVLLPRSDQALADLPAALVARGALVTDVHAYSVKPAEPIPYALEALCADGVDVALFFSPSALRGLSTMLRDRPLAQVLHGAAIACIGPTTAAAAQEMGLRVDIRDGAHTGQGLIAALLKWRGARG